MNEIKKCPFCGGEPTFEQVHRCANELPGTTEIQIVYSMKCKTCGYEFGREASLITAFNDGDIKVYEDGHKKLVDKWNKRAEEPQEKKESNIEWALKKIEKGDFYFSICEIANYIKNGKPCAECDECEFQDDEDAINYLLAPYEGKDDLWQFPI